MRRTPVALARRQNPSVWPVIVNCILVAITIRRMIRLSVDHSPGAADRIMRTRRGRSPDDLVPPYP